jgi:hypothetical protein
VVHLVKIHHRDTENTEVAQRKIKAPAFGAEAFGG